MKQLILFVSFIFFLYTLSISQTMMVHTSFGATQFKLDDIDSVTFDTSFTVSETHMVSIPGGTFQMGSTLEEKEKPVHTVTLSPYYMKATEVTQADFDGIMNLAFGAYYVSEWSSKSFGSGPGYPVYGIIWSDAVLYCNEKSKREGKDTVYTFKPSTISYAPREITNIQYDITKNGYRLPTEAEWEFACRGGSTTDYYWGDDSTRAGDYAWYGANSKDPITNLSKCHPVGTKLPNAYGLYDMAGNSWEWCNDWDCPYSSSTRTNPTGPDSPCSENFNHIVSRGSDALSSAYRMRSAFRWSFAPGYTYCGFRYVLNAE